MKHRPKMWRPVMKLRVQVREIRLLTWKMPSRPVPKMVPVQIPARARTLAAAQTAVQEQLVPRVPEALQEQTAVPGPAFPVQQAAPRPAAVRVLLGHPS